MREFCENKRKEKRFKMQNLSKAGLGKEQNEKDSFEIEGRERKDQRRLSFYRTRRTYCKKPFSRSQINAFVC